MKHEGLSNVMYLFATDTSTLSHTYIVHHTARVMTCHVMSCYMCVSVYVLFVLLYNKYTYTQVLRSIYNIIYTPLPIASKQIPHSASLAALISNSSNGSVIEIP
jgi:hypothetical protein